MGLRIGIFFGWLGGGCILFMVWPYFTYPLDEDNSYKTREWVRTDTLENAFHRGLLGIWFGSCIGLLHAVLLKTRTPAQLRRENAWNTKLREPVVHNPDKKPCPACGFAYAFDGKKCGHCRKVVPSA